MTAKELALAAALVASSVYDVESTMSSRGDELNPIYIKDRREMYPIKAGLDAYLIWLARKEKNKWNRYWWLPSAIATGVQITAGCYNEGII